MSTDERIINRYLNAQEYYYPADVSGVVLRDRYIVQSSVYDYEIVYSHNQRRYVIVNTNNPKYYPTQ